MNLIDELHAVGRVLEAAGIRYAVCGGIAVTIHGATRTTKDIDILVLRGDVPRVLDVVRPLGFSYVAFPKMKRLAGRAQDAADIEKLESGDET